MHSPPASPTKECTPPAKRTPHATLEHMRHLLWEHSLWRKVLFGRGMPSVKSFEFTKGLFRVYNGQTPRFFLLGLEE